MAQSQLQGAIIKRLLVIGVPRHIILPFSEVVCRWKENSGKEWTIERLKSLKVDLIRVATGLPSVTPWVSRNRKGEFSGPIGSIFRWASRSEACFAKALQALQVYSMFTFSKVTQKQTSKFLSAVTMSQPEHLSSRFIKDFGYSLMSSFPKLLIDRNSDNSLLLFRGSPSKRLPGFSWEPSTPQDEGIVGQANYFYLQEHKALGRKFGTLYRPVLEGLDHHWSIIHDHDSDDVIPSRLYGGNIAFIQEAGGKLRSVASPYLVHQLALKHLGETLYRFVRTLPWDCTHDQSKPFEIVSDHLSQNRVVHSVDLSSATDHFPLSVQLVVLKSLMGKQPDIDLFETISRSTWKSPLGPISWTKGQPLGLYPSFAAFTLTHGLLLWHLNGNSHNEDFFVVGDDVIILKDDLYRRYIGMLEKMGCPHSPLKSISSATLCEFAGKIITSSRVIPQMKWRELSNDNFLDLCRMLGPRSRSLLSPRQRRVFDKVSHCLEPLGLNFSFPGSDFLQMQEITRQTFPETENVTDSLMGLTSLVNRNLYTSEFRNPAEVVNNNVIQEKFRTFDEKVKLVLFKLLGWVSDPIQGFSKIPGALDNQELPMDAPPIGRITMLKRYEDLLHLS